MPQYWEQELRAFLLSLGVIYDSSTLPVISSPVEEQNMPSITPSQSDSDDRAALIKSEMESTLALISELMQSGYMDEDVYRDILRVFHALMRPQNQAGVSEEEWYIESGAAILHFCRIVTRLSNALVRRRQ